MTSHLDNSRLSGIWSATPTPLREDRTLDCDSIPRLVDHHLRLGVKGLFLAGTCGEGPWLPRKDQQQLISETAAASRGRLVLAAQITDNSAERMLENARIAADAGADIAVVAPPYFLMNATTENVTELYVKTIQNCPLPVGIYDRGSTGAVPVPNPVIQVAYAQDNVVLVKDSSNDPARRDIALEARRERPELRLLTGYEFDIVSYLVEGYNGALLGGGIFNGCLANTILDACAAGDVERARDLQQRMNDLMWDVYGGKEITCWLTGLKELLVRLEVFETNTTFLNYPLTERCDKDIDKAIQRERDVLLP